MMLRYMSTIIFHTAGDVGSHSNGAGSDGETPSSAGVRQDKRPPHRAPTRLIYAEPTHDPVGAQPETETRCVRGEKRIIRRRSMSIHLRCDIAVGLEFRQFVKSQGLTLSATGNAIFKEYLARRLREQQDVLVEPVIRKEIRQEMSELRRMIGLMYVESRQNYYMLVNLLGRTKSQRAMDADTLTRIRDTSREQARQDLLSRTSPLDELTKQEVCTYLMLQEPVVNDGEGEDAP